MTATTQVSATEKMTPAGIQSAGLLARHRMIAAIVNIAIYLGLLYWLGSILAVSGWSFIDVLIFGCFAIAAPWSVRASGTR